MTRSPLLLSAVAALATLYVSCTQPLAPDDAGVADAGVMDAGAMDSGVPDASSTDAGMTDAGSVGGSVTSAETGFAFGGKAHAAPLKYLDFATTPAGTNPFDAGFDFMDEDTTGGRCSLAVAADSGVAGGLGALKLTVLSGAQDGPSTNNFPTAGLVVAPTNALFVSFFYRLVQTDAAALTEMIQSKLPRLGTMPAVVNPNPRLIGKQLYSASGAKLSTNHWDGPGAQSEEVYWYNAQTSNDTHQWADLGQRTSFLDGRYHQVAMWARYNGLGLANGEETLWVDGQARKRITDAQPRLAASEFIDWVIPNPGITNGASGHTWESFLSAIYVDDTLAHVAFGNAARLVDCTGFFVVPALEWREDVIRYDATARRPAGFDWLYVTTAEGEVNPLGVPRP